MGEKALAACSRFAIGFFSEDVDLCPMGANAESLGP